MIANAEGKPDKLASLYSSHPVLLDFSLLLIVKKELADLTLTQETFSKYLEGVTTIDSTQAVIVVYCLVLLLPSIK